jgi:hypothetical protein
LIVIDVEALLPAPSVHDPEMLTAPPSGPPYVPEVQDAMPDGPPTPLKLKETGFVYPPLPSGARESEAHTAGGIESYSTVTLLP